MQINAHHVKVIIELEKVAHVQLAILTLGLLIAKSVVKNAILVKVLKIIAQNVSRVLTENYLLANACLDSMKMDKINANHALDFVKHAKSLLIFALHVKLIVIE